MAEKKNTPKSNSKGGILKKLSRIKELPTIPSVLSEPLYAIYNPDTSAAQLARIIERDQSLTARILRVANSPFYGFSRKISTIDLAVVVMGMKTIKEIALTLLVRRLFSKVSPKLLDVKSFWSYSVYCASASKLLAKKLGYKVSGEAFIAGLMHDIGIIIEAEFFTEDFKKIRYLQNTRTISFLEAENQTFKTNHTEIGAWLSNKWNLPSHLTAAIEFHHTHYSHFLEEEEKNDDINFDEVGQPLTAIVSLSEWFAGISGHKNWALESKESSLYLSNEVFDDISEHEILEQNSAFEVLRMEIENEFNKASVISNFLT